MLKKIVYFIVDVSMIEEILCELELELLYSFNKFYKNFRKYYKEIKNNLFNAWFAREIESAYKYIKQNNFLYYSVHNNYIAIAKIRIKDHKSNSGKSNGWRVIGLVDHINGLFILLLIYRHSTGKDSIDSEELKEIKNVCDEYALKIGGRYND